MPRGVPANFSTLTPFYFVKAGLFVSLPAIATGALLVAALLAVKIAAKLIGVWPVTRAFRFSTHDSAYTTLLMATGLTFGTISALFGLTNHISTNRATGAAILPS